jgi:hypothetical protein
MKRLHYLIALSIVWFFLLYNTERLVEPLDITPFVYLYGALCALWVILLPGLPHFTSFWLILLLLALYLVLKRELGYQVGWQNLPVTITEVSAITITLVLVSSIRYHLKYLQEMLANVIIGPVPDEVHTFGTGQGQIYREIRRARRHQRPVSLLAISAADEFFNVEPGRLNGEMPLHPFLREMQRDFMKKYINTRLANLLTEELEDSAVIAQRNDHFVTLLPETGREEMTAILKKLKCAAEEKLGLKLKTGASTFPDRAVTFETLLEQAEAEMMQQSPSTNHQVELVTAEIKRMPSV